jgi:hypothetical protein
VRLSLRIEPEDSSLPFDGEQAMVVSRGGPPPAGPALPGLVRPANRSQFVLATKVDTPPRWRAPAGRQGCRGGSGGTGPGGADSAPAADPLDRLAKLHQLHLAGALSEEDFRTRKSRILAD